MSEHWSPASAIASAKPAGAFVPWSQRLIVPPEPVFVEDDDDAPVLMMPPAPAAPAVDLAAIDAAAYARGLEDGRRALQRDVAAEQHAVAQLAETLENLRAEPPAALAALLSEAVGRLVRQIVGEVAIDADLLRERAEVVAAFVTDGTKPARLKVHPDDLARLAGAELDVELVADPLLAPGSVVLETADGWIEDGPGVALDELAAALDRMGITR